MDTVDDFRAGERQQIIVALEIARMIGKTLAAIIGLLQFALLDHRSHRTVKHEQALLQEGGKFGGAISLHESLGGM